MRYPLQKQRKHSLERDTHAHGGPVCRCSHCRCSECLWARSVLPLSPGMLNRSVESTAPCVCVCELFVIHCILHSDGGGPLRRRYKLGTFVSKRGVFVHCTPVLQCAITMDTYNHAIAANLTAYGATDRMSSCRPAVIHASGLMMPLPESGSLGCVCIWCHALPWFCHMALASATL